jgi:hypothetical protein
LDNITFIHQLEDITTIHFTGTEDKVTLKEDAKEELLKKIFMLTAPE